MIMLTIIIIINAASADLKKQKKKKKIEFNCKVTENSPFKYSKSRHD